MFKSIIQSKPLGWLETFTGRSPSIIERCTRKGTFTLCPMYVEVLDIRPNDAEKIHTAASIQKFECLILGVPCGMLLLTCIWLSSTINPHCKEQTNCEDWFSWGLFIANSALALTVIHGLFVGTTSRGFDLFVKLNLPMTLHKILIHILLLIQIGSIQIQYNVNDDPWVTCFLQYLKS